MESGFTLKKRRFDRKGRGAGAQPESLKHRIRVLLLSASLFPLILLGLIAAGITLSLYRQSTDQIITAELFRLSANMNVLIDSMKYMSQILAGDNDFLTVLRDYSGTDEMRRAVALRYLRERIAIYETSNPNISNITFFYGDRMDENGRYEAINISLAQGSFMDERYLFSTQYLLRFFGPHTTRSLISDYKAISMVRRINAGTERPIYLYIESGFKMLGDFPSQTLDRLGAVYAVVSDKEAVVYSSDADRLPQGLTIQGSAREARISGIGYRIYENLSNRGWALRTYVNKRQLTRYTASLALGFLSVSVLAVGVSIFLGSFAWSIIEEVRKQEQSNARLEIKLLMHKINPHFIHNTLYTLKCYAEINGQSDVERFISSLNRLLMYNMEKGPKTTLRSELVSIEDYIELQKMKYPIVFTVSSHLPEVMLDARSPRFILYPLVENAIMHGAKGEGEISLELDACEDGRIRIRVRDTGSALQEQELKALQIRVENIQSRKGIGLAYVHDALADFFGEEGNLRFYAEGGGNVFEIRIPYSTEP